MIRDISIMLRGTVLAQAIGLLSLPILSRLFPPEAFGHYSVYQAAAVVLTGLACLRYDMAILTAESEEEAIGLFVLSLGIANGLAVVMVLPLAVIEALSGSLSKWFGFSIVWFVPAVALVGSLLAGTALLTRLAAFRTSARAKLLQSGSAAVTSLVMGILMPSATALVIGDLTGRAAGAALQTGGVRTILLAWWHSPRPSGYYPALARRFDHFPRLSVPGGLLNNGASFLAPAAMLAIYGPAIAGQFSLVDRAVSLPLSMIVVTVSQVFTAHFGRVLRESRESALGFFWRVVLGAAGLAVIPALLGAVFAPTLFALVFGAKWEIAGHYARILALMYFTALSFGPVSNGLVILDRLSWQLAWEAVRLVLLALVWATVAYVHPAVEHTLALWGGVTIVVNLAYIAMVHNTIRRQDLADSRLKEI